MTLSRHLGEPGRRIAVPLLFALVAVALRTWHLGWGLATSEWLPDELIWHVRAAAFVPLSWRSFDLAGPACFSYPTLYGYVVGLLTALAGAAGIATTPQHTILLARGTAVASDLVTVVVVGILGTRMYSPGAGRLAAIFMAVAPMAVMQTHFASVDSLLTATVALTLLAAFQLGRDPSPRRAALAGAAAAAGASTKFTGTAALAAVAWAILDGAPSPRRTPRWRLVLAALGGFAVTGVVACPPCVLRAGEYVLWWRQLGPQVADSTIFANAHLVPSLGWYGRPYLYELVASLPYSLGWPLYALALAGVGLAARRRSRAERLLLACVIPYFVAIGSFRLVYTRYLLPLFPGLTLLAAAAADTVGARRRAALAIPAAVALYGLVLSASQTARFTMATFEEAGLWIRAHCPPGAEESIHVAGPADPFNYYHLAAPLRAAGLTYEPVADDRWAAVTADVIVLPEWHEVSLSRDRPDSAGARALASLVGGDTGYKVGARWRSWYLQRDFYAWLDPAFGPNGGFDLTVYVRRPRLTHDGASP